MESTRRMMGLLTKVLLCVTGGLSKGDCLAVYHMSREICRLYRKSGPLFTGQYLKQVAFCLQWYVGGRSEDRPSCKVYVSLTRSGIPRLIPPAYRRRLRGDADPLVVKIVLSICTLSRMILVHPKGGLRLDSSTIESKRDIYQEDLAKVCLYIKAFSNDLISFYLPDFLELPLELGYKFKPLFSSGPNSSMRPFAESYLSCLGPGLYDRLTPYHTLPLDALALLTWWDEFEIQKAGEVFFNQMTIYPRSTHQFKITKSIWLENFGKYMISLISCGSTVWGDFQYTQLNIGKLGRKLEGSGKVRVFAMTNPILQTMVRPVHDWSMQLLSMLPTDGTYDQLRPLERLSGKKELYSFDLKSATDLLPAILLKETLSSLFGPDVGEAWYLVLTKIPFLTPDRRNGKQINKHVIFLQGQPLGYYSSWSMFTLVHHMIVWMSAAVIYPDRRFYDYAILGDDIVIADALVAEQYKLMMQQCCGVISKEKSLVSDKGCCEFAKRFIMRNHRADRTDASPVSIPLIRSLHGFSASFVFSVLGTNPQNSFRLKGAGYKVYSRLSKEEGLSPKCISQLTNRWKRLALMLVSPSGSNPIPLDLWFGYPMGILSCYQKGLLYSYLLDLVRPKDIDEYSVSSVRALWAEESEDLLESHLGSFVKMHLEYVVWFSKASCRLDLSLEELVKPPISPYKVERRAESLVLRRYGIIYKGWMFIQRNLVILVLEEGHGCRRDFVVTRLFQSRFQIDLSLLTLDNLALS